MARDDEIPDLEIRLSDADSADLAGEERFGVPVGQRRHDLFEIEVAAGAVSQIAQLEGAFTTISLKSEVWTDQDDVLLGGENALSKARNVSLRRLEEILAVADVPTVQPEDDVDLGPELFGPWHVDTGVFHAAFFGVERGAPELGLRVPDECAFRHRVLLRMKGSGEESRVRRDGRHRCSAILLHSFQVSLLQSRERASSAVFAIHPSRFLPGAGEPFEQLDLPRVVDVVKRDSVELALERGRRRFAQGRDHGAQPAVLRVEQGFLFLPLFRRGLARAREPVAPVERKGSALLPRQAAPDRIFPVGRVERELPNRVPPGRGPEGRLGRRHATQRPLQVRPVPGLPFVRLVQDLDQKLLLHAASSSFFAPFTPSPPCRMISATAATMPAAARPLRSVSSSPANSVPSSTATIGLTYAYVETRAGVVTFKSQT